LRGVAAKQTRYGIENPTALSADEVWQRKAIEPNPLIPHRERK